MPQIQKIYDLIYDRLNKEKGAIINRQTPAQNQQNREKETVVQPSSTTTKSTSNNNNAKTIESGNGE